MRSIDREIWRLALPAFGALIAEPLYILADTAVVGHLGTPELGGLAVASTVLITTYSVFVFLAYGTTAAVARLLGAGDEGRAAAVAVQSLWLAVIIGVLILGIGLVAAPWLLSLLGATELVRSHALLYLRVSLFGVPATMVVLASTGYLRGLQDTRTPLIVALVSAGFNLAFELVLIPGLGFGIGASALSTVVAQLGAAAWYLTATGRAVRTHEVSRRPDPVALRSLLSVSRDLFIRTAALRGSFTLGTAVAARIGVVDLAAHQVAFEIWSFLALALDAIAIAAQALVGRMLGAGDGEGARRAGRRMIEWGVAAGVVFGAGVLIAAPHLAAVFSGDDAVVSLSATLLIWVAVLQPVSAVVFVLDGVLIGAGDQRFLAWAMVVAFLAFAPVAIFVLLADLSIVWLWAAIAVLMATRVIALGLRFAGPRWVVLGAV